MEHGFEADGRHNGRRTERGKDKKTIRNKRGGRLLPFASSVHLFILFVLFYFLAVCGPCVCEIRFFFPTFKNRLQCAFSFLSTAAQNGSTPHFFFIFSLVVFFLFASSNFRLFIHTYVPS